MLPGFWLLDDLDALEAAGLSRYQVPLATTTRTPGEFIARTKHGDAFGVVAEGRRADLLLTDEDPLDSLKTLRHPLGVMVAGTARRRIDRSDAARRA